MPGEEGGGDAGHTGAMRVLKTVGSVVAPTTLITALLFYFGWVRSRTQARDLGLEERILGSSTQDYLLRSPSSLYLPLGGVLLLGLIWLAGHWAICRWIRSPVGPERPERAGDVAQGGEAQVHQRARWVRRISIVVAASGVAAFAIGLFAAFVVRAPLDPVPPIALGLGVALTSYGLFVGRRFGGGVERRPPGGSDLRAATTAMVTVVALLLCAALFWMVSDYAQKVGHGLAARQSAGLTYRPRVVLYSERPLHIQADGVREAVLEGDSGYRFRYEGLQLLLFSGAKYFLVPGSWSIGRGPIIALPDNDTIRLEYLR